MKRSSAVGVLLFAALLITVGGLAMYRIRQTDAAPGGGASAQGFEPAEAVNIVEAREVAWQPTADLVGTVIALRSVIVRNELAGVVTSVGFQSGSIVEQGQVILTQDDTLDRADLEAARASVRVAEANIPHVDARIRLAELELQRITSALADRAVVDLEVDRARMELDTARADRARWLAEVDQAGARVAQVEARLAKLTIAAPFRARAGLRSVHEGQYLAEGADVVALQELTDTIYLDFAIPQEYAPRVTAGTAVMATGELLGPDPVRIEVVAADATVNNTTRNLRVRAVVDNRRGTLVPGMFVQVRVPIEAPSSYVVVPSMAVRRAAYGNSVFVIEPDEKGVTRAHQRFVTLGRTLEEDVIVLEGLRVGERIAGAGSFKLRDGAMVMVAPPPGGPGEPVAGEAPRDGGPPEGQAKTGTGG